MQALDATLDTTECTTIDQSCAIAARANDLLIRWARQAEPARECQLPYLGLGCTLNAVLLQEAGHIESSTSGFAMAAEHLTRAGELFEDLPLSTSMYRGVTGWGWALQTFPCANLIPWRDEVLEDLDELLADGIDVTRRPNIDLINGLGGIVVYALARGSASASSALLWEVIEYKVRSCLTEWPRALEVNPTSRAIGDLGVAHGMPGLLAVVIEAVKQELVSPDLIPDLAACLDSVWDEAFVMDGLPAFPARVGTSSQTRLAWCYGGLGLATLFLKAAAIAPKNVTRFQDLCRSSVAQYKRGNHGIRDSSLCHGYAGVAVMVAHLLRSGDLDHDLSASLGRVREDACLSALASEVNEGGKSAFLYFDSTEMRASSNYLEGGPGVALALSAACADSARPWMATLGIH